MPAITVLVTDTFEQWRVKTNQISTQIGDMSALDPTLTDTTLVGALGKLLTNPATKVVLRDSATGAAQLPSGTDIQRPSHGVGKLRYNTTSSRGEISDGTQWKPLGGATGGGPDDAFYENGNRVTTSYQVSANKNAISAGPVTVDPGAVVTVPAGSVWVVV